MCRLLPGDIIQTRPETGASGSGPSLRLFSEQVGRVREVGGGCRHWELGTWRPHGHRIWNLTHIGLCGGPNPSHQISKASASPTNLVKHWNTYTHTQKNLCFGISVLQDSCRPTWQVKRGHCSLAWVNTCWRSVCFCCCFYDCIWNIVYQSVQALIYFCGESSLGGLSKITIRLSTMAKEQQSF